MSDLVLVTGGSGFVGSHVVLHLLAAGYRVRTTVRSLTREPEVRKMLVAGGMAANAPLEFAEADLTKDANWAKAASGCAYVLHVASPLPLGIPKHEDELIVPAREGTLRVLRAARDAGVRRVVVTSSFAAIGYGHPQQEAAFTERDWSNLNSGRHVSAYAKSKTLAERAAWDFMAREGKGMELAVVNPVGIFGPVLGADYAVSILLVQRLLEGALPGCPKLWFGVVDVRDVADLQLRAMTAPQAAGERFLAISGDGFWMLEVAKMLRRRLPQQAKKVPTREFPNWLLRVFSLINPEVRQLLPELGQRKNASGEKAERVLGWKPRPAEEAIIDSAESLLALGLIKQ